VTAGSPQKWSTCSWVSIRSRSSRRRGAGRTPRGGRRRHVLDVPAHVIRIVLPRPPASVMDRRAETPAAYPASTSRRTGRRSIKPPPRGHPAASARCRATTARRDISRKATSRPPNASFPIVSTSPSRRCLRYTSKEYEGEEGEDRRRIAAGPAPCSRKKEGIRTHAASSAIASTMKLGALPNVRVAPMKTAPAPIARRSGPTPPPPVAPPPSLRGAEKRE